MILVWKNNRELKRECLHYRRDRTIRVRVYAIITPTGRTIRYLILTHASTDGRVWRLVSRKRRRR